MTGVPLIPTQATVPNVLVDASNLRTGGAVQVAASFLDELAQLLDDPRAAARFPWLDAVRVEVSPVVFGQLSETARERLPVRVHDRRWHQREYWTKSPADSRADVSFTVFGPEYGRRRARRRVVGCADVTAVASAGPAAPRLPPLPRIRKSARDVVSRRLFQRADVLIVETAQMRRQVADRLGFPRGDIVVVPNTYHRVFDQPARWRPVPELAHSGASEYLLCYPTRAYPHKNIDILPRVSDILTEMGLRVRFIVTLDAGEWAERSTHFRETTVNVGVLDVEQLPSLYQRCDGAVFPSLLEAFSATPVEAMKMRRVLFASDRPFVRAVCADAPVYVDPESAQSLARSIAATLPDPEAVERQVSRGSDVVADLPSAADRAWRYLEIIDTEASDRPSGAQRPDGAVGVGAGGPQP